MGDIRFSVITVTYNAEERLAKTIESVIDQTCPPYEYLVIDGCSGDRTLAICEGYREKLEKRGIRFTVVSEKDTGIYNAMNKGINLAEGDFLSFLNAGDWYQKDALNSIRAFYREESFDLTYGGLNYINPNGTVTIKKSRWDRFPVSSRHWNHPSMFLRRELYEKMKFDESFKRYADFELYLRLRKSGARIRVCDRVITNFVADGVSTEVQMKKVLSRAGEKYRAYRKNGYGRIYWLESYGWEIMKSIYFRIKS